MKYLTVILGLVSTISLAQDRNVIEPDKVYDEYAFIDAQHMYLNMVEDGYGTSNVYKKLGDTYYFNNDYSNSHKWYTKLFENNDGAIESEYYFRYVQSLKAVKDYDKADALLIEYQKIKGADSFTEIFVNDKNYLEMIELQSWRYTIKNLEINSESQEFGTAYLNGSNEVVYASSKDSASMINRRHKWSERQFLDLYVAQIDSASLELVNPRKFGNGDQKLNTKFHESNAVFTKDGQTIYYTSNNYFNKKYKKSKDEINKLKIFRASKTEDGWGNIEELAINSDEWSTAHPALNGEESRLYFSSDRPGSVTGLDGKSSSDIWYVEIDSTGTLSEPVNLTAVNTIGKELFPFISEKEDLYFSSTGHMGLGGLDVFVISLAEAHDSEKLKITNVGKPINSSYDDFSFVIKDSTMTGYFSSNRKSGQGLDDIYSLKQNKPLACKDEIVGIVTDEETGELIPGATVVLLDVDNNEVERVIVKKDAAYSFTVLCESTYSIQASKEEYAPADAVTTTPDVIATIDLPISLKRSIDDKIQKFQVGDDLASVLDIPMIYFDFDKSNIRPDAEVELQKVLQFMKAFPTVKVDIRSHTDSRAPDLYNMKLSDRRAKSTRAYLIMKGINADRLTAQGYGEFQLVNECSNGVDCTEEQHQLNRRSEFIVVGK
ncbi:OmpA family protein [Nonlabens sp. SCSIO 43208]|uniref:OmpA family protein n=1 Tax=Nonlabens sp. SCSIO 43208 TaxID=2793009 RepID=UPI003D6BC82D